MPNSSTNAPNPSRPFTNPLTDPDLYERFAQFLIWSDSNGDIMGARRIYVDIAGDLVTGTVLSQLLYWSSPSRHTGKYRMADDEFWVAKSRSELSEECRVSMKQVDRALEIIRGLGLIETCKAGFAGKAILHYRLNYCNFLHVLEHQRRILGPDYEKKFRRKSDDILPRVLPKRQKAC